jgi:hypothetical protein
LAVVQMGVLAVEQYLLALLQIPLAMLVRDLDVAYRTTYVLGLGEFSLELLEFRI